jgi:phage baseplate assembly protein W
MKFPLQFYAGGVATSTGEKHVEESLIQIIGTELGEYLFRPDFGSRIGSRVFDPVNVAALVGIDIRDALRKYELRVKLISVVANLQDSNKGVVGIEVKYQMKGRAEIAKLNFSLGR